MDINQALQLVTKACDSVVCNGPDRRQLEQALATLLRELKSDAPAEAEGGNNVSP